ncbi:DUF6126 family protein [Streptomyces glaucescens]|uniref:Putative membrane protein n=1 Tax=Streptomyces glaucescens TaxID=1907 RepID=A0A089Z746_STRGA|nr:DUF6126 family protein [Streptomyces glaucescens]AIS01601.1 putative membrane protein [Streptomyces glaucescens]
MSRIQQKLDRQIWVRLFIYVVAGHAFAAFLYLLFALGGK